MTTTNEATSEKRGVTTFLPWGLAAGAFVLFFLTRDAWQTIAGTQLIGVVSGWSFHGDLTRPLYWLVTLPIRLLPDAWVPLGLNLFSILCGALTLGLLARSVALLPQDRTEDQRLRERSPFALLTIRSAWLPPVIAVLACGLQWTFWEQATGISTDIFDLLVFAYVIRCLLEFRLQGEDSWLLRAAFVYGAGMTGNWAMVAFAPIFLAALIWFKGLSFFSAGFLGRLLFLGGAGLCFYLLMPLVSALSHTAPESFWEALKANLGFQKNYLATFIFNKGLLLRGEHPLWVLALPSLLPVLALSIRWPATFGDHSPLGRMLASLAYQVLYACFLVVCAWTLLDAQFSPRNYEPELTNYNLTMLPLYYLAALSLGYFSGYFLLCFGGAKPKQRLPRVEPAYTPALNAVVTGIVWALLLFMPAMLVYANLPCLRRSGPILHQYAELKAKALPRDAVVLADNPADSILVQAALIEQGTRKQHIVLDTGSLTDPVYHRFLARKHPGAWNPQFDPTRGDAQIVGLLEKASRNHPLYYLHPSFGYYFEMFYLEPLGSVYHMVPRGTNSLYRPPLTAESITSNQAFWASAETSQFQPITALLTESNRWTQAPVFLGRVQEELSMVRRANSATLPLTSFYSRQVNYWGVQLQRNGRPDDAAHWFERAMRLNPENLSALINLQCNQNIKAGKSPRIEIDADLNEKIQKRRGALSWTLNMDGPVDEPSACLETGSMLHQGGNFVQATEEYKRAAELMPNDLWPRIKLAEALLLRGAYPEGMEVLNYIHAHEAELGVDRSISPEVLRVELAACLMRNDIPAGEQVVRKALAKYTGDENLLAMASHVYLSTGHSSNALQMLEAELALRPNDRGALINLGAAWIRLTNYANAVPPLTRVVEMGTNSSPQTADAYYRALFNRGVAYDRNNQLDLAQRDFEQLQAALPQALAVTYALADIGYRKKDTNLAVRNYEAVIQTITAQSQPTNTPVVSNALERLKELKRQGG